MGNETDLAQKLLIEFTEGKNIMFTGFVEDFAEFCAQKIQDAKDEGIKQTLQEYHNHIYPELEKKINEAQKIGWKELKIAKEQLYSHEKELESVRAEITNKAANFAFNYQNEIGHANSFQDILKYSEEHFKARFLREKKTK